MPGQISCREKIQRLNKKCKIQEIHFLDKEYDYEVYYTGNAQYSLEWEDGYDTSDINIIKFFKILDNGNLEEILLNNEYG